MKKMLFIPILLLVGFSSNLFANPLGGASAVPEMEGDNDKNNWSGMVGLVGLSAPEYVGGDEEKGAGAPLIVVNYKDTVYFKVNTLGVWLWKPNDSFRVGLAAIPRKGIDADDVPSSAGGGLSEDRDAQVEAGINVLWKEGKFSLEGLFLTATDQSEGSSIIVRSRYAYPVNKQVTLIGGLDVEMLDKDIVDYYYRPDGATLGGNGADDATNTSLIFVATYNINSEWVALGGFKLTQLDDIIKDSPITEDDTYNVVFAGAAWKF